MLTYTLTHPPLLGALAAAGHGSRVLLTDGNFPLSTHVNQAATIVHLNLRPGMLTVSDVLPALLDAVDIEHATVMKSGGGPVPAHEEYRAALGGDASFEAVDRFAFYDLARSRDVAIVVATGERRLYANLLLTIGVVGGHSDP